MHYNILKYCNISATACVKHEKLEGDRNYDRKVGEMKKVRYLLLGILLCVFAVSGVAAEAAGNYVRLDGKQAACLLVDHQTGLFSLVQD